VRPKDEDKDETTDKGFSIDPKQHSDDHSLKDVFGLAITRVSKKWARVFIESLVASAHQIRVEAKTRLR
jgi:hypothetical protein